MMTGNAQWIHTDPVMPDGDAGELLHAVGTAEALPGLTAVLTGERPRLNSPDGLRHFLHGYLHEILLPVELPAVLTAWEAAGEGHFRDLVRLDRRLCDEPCLQSFRAASCAVGRRQLNKLRPLRDQRFLQRYREAVEHGEASAWHTTVYGLTLSLYSLPLRNGLQHLATRTLAGFAMNAATDFGLRLRDCENELRNLVANLPGQVNTVLDHSGIGSLGLFDPPQLP